MHAVITALVSYFCLVVYLVMLLSLLSTMLMLSLIPSLLMMLMWVLYRFLLVCWTGSVSLLFSISFYRVPCLLCPVKVVSSLLPLDRTGLMWCLCFCCPLAILYVPLAISFPLVLSISSHRFLFLLSPVKVVSSLLPLDRAVLRWGLLVLSSFLLI